MEKIDKQLNNLSMMEIPAGLHQSVMRKINYYKKLQPVFFATFILLTLYFIIVIWQIDVKLINAEFIDMMQDFFDVFSFNFSFINTILGSFFEIISPALVLSAVLSLASTIYLGKKINLYQFAKF